MRSREIGCIVLAGGKGLRLGRDKALETFGNRSLLQKVVSQVSFLGGDIILVTAAGQSSPQLAGQLKLRVVADIYPGKGPLGGIYTGLVTSVLSCNLVVACDMPFLNQALLRYMIRLSADSDVVVPRLGDLVEPLHAVYSKNCLPAMERLLKEDSLSVHRLFGSVKVRYVEAEEISRFDPEHLSFFNINTKADLEKARKIIKKRHES